MVYIALWGFKRDHPCFDPSSNGVSDTCFLFQEQTSAQLSRVSIQIISFGSSQIICVSRIFASVLLWCQLNSFLFINQWVSLNAIRTIILSFWYPLSDKRMYVDLWYVKIQAANNNMGQAKQINVDMYTSTSQMEIYPFLFSLLAAHTTKFNNLFIHWNFLFL